jgi:hypothetical protein
MHVSWCAIMIAGTPAELVSTWVYDGLQPSCRGLVSRWTESRLWCGMQLAVGTTCVALGGCHCPFVVENLYEHQSICMVCALSSKPHLEHCVFELGGSVTWHHWHTTMAE